VPRSFGRDKVTGPAVVLTVTRARTSIVACRRPPIPVTAEELGDLGLQRGLLLPPSLFELEVVLRDDAKSDGTFEMGADRVCGAAKVSASVHYQHWREQPEDAVRGYLELVIDASGIAVAGEAHAVAPFDRLEVRHDPQMDMRLELPKLLDDLAEATQAPLEPCAVAVRLIVHPA